MKVFLAHSFVTRGIIKCIKSYKVSKIIATCSNVEGFKG